VRLKVLHRRYPRAQKAGKIWFFKKEEDMEQDAWRSTGVKIVSDVKEWRKAHPKATVVDIEEDVHRRMMP